MYNFASNEDGERKVLIEEITLKTGIDEAKIEKDFWMCLVMRYLFQDSPWKERMIFKGGTSLSKAYGVIERFSEDVDIVLDWRMLGYAFEEPWEERTKSKQGLFVKEAGVKTTELLREEFLPRINRDIEELTGHGGRFFIRQDERKRHSEHTIGFDYPKSHNLSSHLPEIRLEFGGFSSWIPWRMMRITSIIGERYPQVFEEASIRVPTSHVERTFWEKIVILHKEAHRPPSTRVADRYSRHYYDVYRLYNSAYRESILASIELLREVHKFNNKFYFASYAKYLEAWPGTLKIYPTEKNIDILRRDYLNMKSMFYGDYPNFDLILSEIKRIETEINALTRAGDFGRRRRWAASADKAPSSAGRKWRAARRCEDGARRRRSRERGGLGSRVLEQLPAGEEGAQDVAVLGQLLPAALLAVQYGADRGHVEPGQLYALAGLQEGAAGGDHVLQHHHGVALPEVGQALHELVGAVALGLLAHEQALQGLALLPGDDGGGGDQGVGAHGHAAHGLDVHALGAQLGDELLEERADEPGALGVEGGHAAVEVVVAASAGREQEVALPVGALHQDAGETALEFVVHGLFCAGAALEAGRGAAPSWFPRAVWLA